MIREKIIKVSDLDDLEKEILNLCPSKEVTQCMFLEGWKKEFDTFKKGLEILDFDEDMYVYDKNEFPSKRTFNLVVMKILETAFVCDKYVKGKQDYDRYLFIIENNE